MKFPEFDTRQTQQAIVLIGVIALITLCTVFSQIAFVNLSLEANNGTITNSTTANTYSNYIEAYKFIYIIGLLLVIAAIVIAFTIMRKTATR
jgi:hypothetical protein